VCSEYGNDSNSAEHASESPERVADSVDKEEGDSGIDANSQGSCSSNDVKAKDRRKEKKKKGANSDKSKAEKENNPPDNSRGNAASNAHNNPNNRIAEVTTPNQTRQLS